MPLLFLFIVIPVIEIALFVTVGRMIGLGWTLAVVLATAIVGSFVVRQQGALALEDLRRFFNSLSDPTEALAHGAMILFAGALLITPGFFTDTLGFLLLLPGVRGWVYRALRARVRFQSFTMGPQSGQDFRPRPSDDAGEVIEGEFEEVPPGKRPTHRPSGWTKH